MDLQTPYAVVTSVTPAQPTSKRELVRLSRQMEAVALSQPPATMAAALQDQRFLTSRTREVYRRLASRGAAVTLLARGLQGWLAPGVRGVDLDDDDPLVDEWVVVLLSADRPGVLAATDLRRAPFDLDADRDLERDFAFAVSHEPDVVAACASLLERSSRGSAV